MVQFAARHSSVEMHHHADAARHPMSYVEFASADQRNIPQAQCARRRGRKLAVQIVGRGEDDADKAIVIDVVAFEHPGDERLGLRIDLGLGVLIASSGTAER